MLEQNKFPSYSWLSSDDDPEIVNVEIFHKQFEELTGYQLNKFFGVGTVLRSIIPDDLYDIKIIDKLGYNPYISFHRTKLKIYLQRLKLNPCETLILSTLEFVSNFKIFFKINLSNLEWFEQDYLPQKTGILLDKFKDITIVDDLDYECAETFVFCLESKILLCIDNEYLLHLRFHDNGKVTSAFKTKDIIYK